MNLPNKLTLLRIALVPVYLVLAAQGTPTMRWLALAVFALASLTDLLDGHIARSRGLITNFGKFMDPIADKLLVIPAAVLMVQQQVFPAWMCILWIAREFVISGVRLIAAEQGTVIAAGIWGKAKTVAQMAAILLLTVLPAAHWASVCGLWVSTALTVVSCALYVWQARGLLLGDR